MAANASHLSDSKYGYDVVVATTQASINATMRTYLSTLKDCYTYICCYKPSKKDPVQLIDYKDLLKLTNGVDPFAIPNGVDAEKDDRLKTLRKVRFTAGIKITLGVPQNYDSDKSADIPDIITLQQGVNQVGYRMLCADIQIAQMLYDEDGATWNVVSQSQQRNRVWSILSHVDLRFEKVDLTALAKLPDDKKAEAMLGNTPFSRLPEEMQHQLKNMGDNMFGVQQLLFDLNNAGLASVPHFEELSKDSEAMMLITRYFVNVYFDRVQKEGQPVLGYTVTPPGAERSTFAPTDFNFMTCPLKTETLPGLRTLDYICAINGKKLPRRVDFDWDWVTAAEQQEAHGVIAINRDTFANYLKDILLAQAQKVCFRPWTEMHYSYPTWATQCQPQWDNINISNEVTPYKQGDNTIVKLDWNRKSDSQWPRLDGGMAAISNECRYYANVTVKGDTIEVESRFVVYLFYRSSQTRKDGDVVNKLYKDTYKLGVDENGKMSLTKTTKKDDFGWMKNPSDAADFWANASDTFNAFASMDWKGSDFHGVSLDALQNFIFPGGRTFKFTNFHFSEYQDLICQIKYA